MNKRGWIIIVLALLCATSAIAYEILEEKETKTISTNGKELELSVVTISEIQKSALFKLNGKYFSLKPGENYEAEGIIIILKDIITSGKATQKSIARIEIGGSQLTKQNEELPSGPYTYEIRGTAVNINPYFYNIEFEEEAEDITETLRKKAEERGVLEKKPREEPITEKPLPKTQTKEEFEVQKPSIKKPEILNLQLSFTKAEMDYNYGAILMIFVLIILTIFIIKELGIKHIKPRVDVSFKKNEKRAKKKKKK